MKFQVENRGTVMAINPRVPHIIISISDTAEDRADPPANEFTRDILFVAFHDTNVSRPGMTLFDENHAKQIINFYVRYRGEVDLIVAHCNAGMSRSPAVLAALQKVHIGDDSIWFKTKTPNSLVYNGILSEAYERNLFAS